jgi:hypothetical protein
MAAWRMTIQLLKVVHLPKEALTMVISCFQDVPVAHVKAELLPDDDFLPSPDLPSMKSARLTC